MRRRTRWVLLVGVVVAAIAGGMAAMRVRPEPPLRFWVHGAERRSGSAMGLFAAPGRDPYSGFGRYCTGCCEVPSPVYESTIDGWRGWLLEFDFDLYDFMTTRVAPGRPGFLAEEVRSVPGASPSDPLWTEFVRLCETLPDRAHPDAAVAGTWHEPEWTDGWRPSRSCDWRLDADGRFTRASEIERASGRWGVADGVVVLLADGEPRAHCRILTDNPNEWSVPGYDGELSGTRR